jgi:hypothetical protein
MFVTMPQHITTAQIQSEYVNHVTEGSVIQNSLVLLPPGCGFTKYLSTESTADSINVGDMPTDG